MRFLNILFVVLFISACGNDQAPGSCSVKEVPEGVEYRCKDASGNETTGIARKGEKGETGEQGPRGEVGPQGEGLQIALKLSCKGAIEGWLENSRYEIDFLESQFSTGDSFLSATTKLYRGSELINERTASAFFITGQKVLSDGTFSMSVQGQSLEVKSQGGVSANLPCSEVK